VFVKKIINSRSFDEIYSCFFFSCKEYKTNRLWYQLYKVLLEISRQALHRLNHVHDLTIDDVIKNCQVNLFNHVEPILYTSQIEHERYFSFHQI
jgi:hypothetical protein